MPLDRCKLSGIPFAASYATNKARAGSRAPNRQTTPHAAAAAHRRSRCYGKFRNIAIDASLAVWTSLVLAGFGLMKHLLQISIWRAAARRRCRSGIIDVKCEQRRDLVYVGLRQTIPTQHRSRGSGRHRLAEIIALSELTAGGNRKARCSAVSTPSATISTPSALARPTTARTIVASSEFVRRRQSDDRSSSAPRFAWRETCRK